MNREVIRCRGPHFFQLATGILAGGNVLRFRAHGGSMYPFVRDGDVVEVKPVQASAVGLGDVVLCGYGEDRLVVHRVIRVNRENGRVVLAIKGDSARHPDRPIYPEQVLGQVIAIERGGRKLPLDGGLRRLTNRLWAWLSPLSPQLYRLPRMTRYVARKIVDHAGLL
ncbi:MAG: signal peptidase I [Anaerolineae bacterium]